MEKRIARKLAVGDKKHNQTIFIPLNLKALLNHAIYDYDNKT